LATGPSRGGAAFRKPSQANARGFKPLGFLGEVVSELRKAVWPTREETTRLTWVVLIVATLVGAILGLYDFTLARTLVKYVILP
jgi:preprotein translocase SecE subunit